jgi:hypothetical protein
LWIRDPGVTSYSIWVGKAMRRFMEREMIWHGPVRNLNGMELIKWWLWWSVTLPFSQGAIPLPQIHYRNSTLRALLEEWLSPSSYLCGAVTE